jgi:hypothetical protein
MFSHLPLSDCSVCNCLCTTVNAYGVDCAGKLCMPAHECDDCTTVCNNYYRYGYDCFGRFPLFRPA